MNLMKAEGQNSRNAVIAKKKKDEENSQIVNNILIFREVVMENLIIDAPYL